MQDIQKTRFIAANYSNLQGLKVVPLGLLLILVIVWANAQKGRANDLSLPLLLAAGIALITLVIYRYYRVRFGKIESKPRQKRMEITLGIAGAAAGVGAFIADTSPLHLPFSLVGLAFAASIAAEYLRMQYYARGAYMLPVSLTAFVLMLVISFLPLLGAGEWWHLLGMRAQLFGVLLVAGAIMVCYGLCEHWFFVRQLPKAER